MSEILNQLKSNPNNPRSIKETQFKKLINSMREFPKMLELRPIIYDKDFMVLGGNMRLEALKHLETEGFKINDSYFMSAENLTEDEKKQFIIKDNIPFGDWDWNILANEWDQQQLTDWGLNVIDYHEVNDLNPDEFKKFDEIETDDLFHLNIAFDTQEEMSEFLKEKEITLDNNYLKRNNKAISIHWPLEGKRDIKSVKFE